MKSVLSFLSFALTFLACSYEADARLSRSVHHPRGPGGDGHGIIPHGWRRHAEIHPHGWASEPSSSKRHAEESSEDIPASPARPAPASNAVQQTSSSSGIQTYLAPAPRWAAYTQSDYSSSESFPTASELMGFNVYIMAFWLAKTGSGAFKVPEFTGLSQSTREWIINDYHSHNISFLVSAFGYGDNPVSDKRDPVAVAQELGAFVKQYDLDGVDVDFEDFNSFLNDTAGKAETWLIEFTQELRTLLPTGQYIITHAPVAPWFTTNHTRYPSGAYRTVHQQVGNLIDWYNVQFYNQGSDYTNCPSLLTKSVAHAYPGSSLFEIASSVGIPLEKLVVGKPATKGDAPNGGFLDIGTMAGCLQQAKSKGWNAGAFLWAYPDASMDVIKQIRSLTWPV